MEKLRPKWDKITFHAEIATFHAMNLLRGGDYVMILVERYPRCGVNPTSFPGARKRFPFIAKGGE